MKSFLFLFTLLGTVSAQAAENLVCSLIKNSDKSKYVSVTVDLTRKLEEVYYPAASVDVGNNSYSFSLEVTRERNKLSLVVTFQDTNDEVGQTGWDIDLTTSQRGKPVVVEPISVTSHKPVMTFVCYHNK